MRFMDLDKKRICHQKKKPKIKYNKKSSDIILGDIFINEFHFGFCCVL